MAVAISWCVDEWPLRMPQFLIPLLPLPAWAEGTVLSLSVCVCVCVCVQRRHDT